MNSKRLITLLPVMIFAALALVFWKGLSGDPSTLPSALINKPVPTFTLKPVDGMNLPGFSDADLKQGKITVVNIWASWRDDIVLMGIANKDNPANATRFLGALGNPFKAVGDDASGRVTIDWGGYGVPETFIVDGLGNIRYKHVGPIAAEDLNTKFAEEIKKAAQPLPTQ
jgi:cytochrome c biogenesis protein CcmG, thiol:disulfide interchange protein DsbE